MKNKIMIKEQYLRVLRCFVAAITMLIFINLQDVYGMRIINTAMISFAAGESAGEYIKNDTMSNPAFFDVLPVNIVGLYPNSDVEALAKDDSVVISFNGKVYQDIKDTASSSAPGLSLYYEDMSGTKPVDWTYLWEDNSDAVGDTLNIGFKFYSQKRYVLKLNSFKDILGYDIKDTVVLFYTTIDNSESNVIFRRDRYGGITQAVLPPYAAAQKKSVVRIKLPEEMIAANDLEGERIGSVDLEHIAQANRRAQREGVFLIETAEYKPYRRFTFYTWSETEGKWLDYFADKNNLPDLSKKFLKDVTIRLPYKKDELPIGTSEQDLKIYLLSYSPEGKSWFWKKLIDSKKSADGEYLTASVKHFSIYTILNPIIPKATKLYQNYPNPFNPSTDGVTKVDFDLAKAGYVTVRVYTILGELVTVLTNRRFYNAGQYYYTDYAGQPQYTITWNGRNGHNKNVASGLYILRFTVDYADAGGRYESYIKVVVER